MIDQLTNMCYLVHFKTLEYSEFRTDMQPPQKKALAEFANDMYNAASFARMVEANSEGELSDSDLLKFYNIYRSKKARTMYEDSSNDNS